MKFSLGGLLVAIALTSCASSPAQRQAWERALAPDPRLIESQPSAPSPTLTPLASPSPSPPPTPAPSPLPTAIASPTPSPASPNPAGAVAQALRSNIAPELAPYLADWAALGTIDVRQPNQPITRRQFARWLVAANNRLFQDRPAQQLHTRPKGTPAFGDVSVSDPDFDVIQGLAEAGIVPSAIGGDPTATRFTPDAPLTRETLLEWKVPLDLRQALPLATVEGIQKSWGFQDANKIEPRSLRAIQADYASGELSNVRRAFGFTTLLQPKKPVTEAEAAAALWYFGQPGQGVSARDAGQSAASPSPTPP